MQENKTMTSMNAIKRLIEAVANATKNGTAKANKEELKATKEALKAVLGRPATKVEIQFVQSETFDVAMV